MVTTVMEHSRFFCYMAKQIESHKGITNIRTVEKVMPQQISSNGFAGGCFLTYAVFGGISPLTCTIFDPNIFLIFSKSIFFHISPTSPKKSIMGNSSTSLLKSHTGATQALTGVKKIVPLVGSLIDLYYYLFDMTGDGITDLCISDEREFVYVISYDEEKKRLTLWNGFDSTWIKLNGTCAVRWDREGINQIYYEFDPNGELLRMTGFMEKEFLNKETQTGETAYIVSMPCYEGNIDSEEKWRMMHDQAYYVKDTGFYYFRVTQDQYDRLTEAYFRAEMEATHNIKKVRYTYDEVISDLE